MSDDDAWLDALGDDEIGALIRRKDWSTTAVGPPQTWPPALRIYVATILRSRQPMFLWWGPELTQFYNAAYRPSFGDGKHPLAMGQPGRECWAEIWEIIGPQIEGVLSSGTPTWHDDALVPIRRNGRIEEVFWTYGYSPAFDDGGAIAGVLVVCTETTQGVLAHRRLALTAKLAEVAGLATDTTEVLDEAFACFEGSASDLPFVVALSEDGEVRRALGVERADLEVIPTVMESSEPAVRVSLERPIAAGPWPEPVTEVSLVRRTDGGHLVVGLSPRLPLDDAYEEFLRQLVGSVDHAKARVRAVNERSTLVAKLEHANRTKDEFLAMLGHELRNPLAPIVTALELIEASGSSELAREHELIERQVRHLTRLVDDLLDVSRIARGKVALKRTECEITQVVQRAVEMVMPLVEEREHELTLDLPSEIRWYGDETRLAQVLANLLTNAARYTAPGGNIHVRARLDEGFVVLSVQDDGQGIEASSIGTIFSLFMQGKRGKDRAEGGLGLGLTLAKNLVERHNGTIVAQSEGLGRGSTFTVRVPQRAARSKASETPPPPERAPQRLLLVDDNDDALELLSALLRHVGHTVVTADSGPRALEAFEAHRPAVVVLDIGLPGMSGYEVARRIRQLEVQPRCWFIALTGYGQEADRKRSAEAGFDVHLVKPVSMEVLDAAIQSGAQRRRGPADA